MNKLLFFILMLLSFISFADNQPIGNDRVLSLPGLGTINDLEFAGTLPIFSKISNKNVGNLFYWYVENQKQDKNTPLVLCKAIASNFLTP